MKLSVALFPVSLVFTSMLLAPAAVAQSDSSGDWLDGASNWNMPGAPIPQAPAPDGDNKLPNCEDTFRLASLPEDELVQAAGWTLVGIARIQGAITVITGMADADGMCRPWDYQVFVFKDGEFAGTLSPTPMDSRRDGSLSEVNLYREENIRTYREGHIGATFSRYTPEDPFCCPSEISRLYYEVEMKGGSPVLVPHLPASTPPNKLLHTLENPSGGS